MESNGLTPGCSDICLTKPITQKHLGDSNCIFRTISFIITGSEEMHMPVRKTIVIPISTIGDFLMRFHVSGPFEGINQYISSTMEVKGT